MQSIQEQNAAKDQTIRDLQQQLEEGFAELEALRDAVGDHDDTLNTIRRLRHAPVGTFSQMRRWRR